MRLTLAVALVCLTLVPGIARLQAQDRSSVSDIRFKVGDHPSLTLGALKLDATARIESNVRMPTRDVGLDETHVAWGSRRAGVEGKLWKRVSFELERDFGRRTTPWRDAFVNVRIAKAFEVETGRFKIPFGRDALTGSANRDFVYRSLAASQLSPSRDTGVMIHGRPFGRVLEYQTGYFVRDGDHSRTGYTDGGRDAIAVRLVAAPLAWMGVGLLAPLQVGLAVARSRLDGRLGLRGRTVLGDGTFFDRLFVNGARRRTGLEAEWAAGPISLSGEYIVVSDERTGMGFDRGDLAAVRAQAWYGAGAWALTGETRRGRLEPRRPVVTNGYGALEVAARVERLRFDAATYPGAPFGFPSGSTLQSNSDRITTLGINWYLNHYLKVQTNVVMESIDDRQRSPAPAAEGRFTSVVARFQFLL